MRGPTSGAAQSFTGVLNPMERGRAAGLRALLGEISPDGEFSEQMREIAVDVWRV